MLPFNTYVIIGPESTGKTTLCKQLAEHFKGIWIPEYARFYVEQIKRPYTYDDVIHIAQKQIETEESIKVNPTDYLFFDTDLIITKVWLLHVYKQCPEWIDVFLKNAYRKSYFLCYPDLPWEFDPVRENPHLREYLFNWYKKELIYYGFNYFIINGKEQQRLNNALINI
ncbi:MAG: ATP-binding protein [Bacteroidales bacterium]|nr:ATP-binding protein [Bacteroidales bacterium]